MKGPGMLSVLSLGVRGLRSLQIPARPGGRDCLGTVPIAGRPAARSRLAKSPATSLTDRGAGVTQASSAVSATAAGSPGFGGPTGSTRSATLVSSGRSVTPMGWTASVTAAGFPGSGGPMGWTPSVTAAGFPGFGGPMGSTSSVTPAGSARSVMAPSRPAGGRR